MIVVTLGTQRFQMNRLIEKMDNIAAELTEEVFIQTGNSTYLPQHCQYKDFVDAEARSDLAENVDIVEIHQPVGIVYDKRLTVGKVDESAHLLLEAFHVMLNRFGCEHFSHIRFA